ncbi:M23 family metallopeptidase [Bacillaceae bacterium SIJ1]|uniref:M23 family metallopeptidase n=1 Tax=Litoribacterium kuwaitense TaxID=1398745 RepID=UPI0013EE2874|nr:M23 family metallopeptidase [Litoribacterium kuwaitense]NGP44745.1 M23 family metallopeptidase [Litoribacterium kuwaitense]
MREEEKQTSGQSKWKQLTKKRWFYPAVYLASAAVILTSVFWMQDNALEEAQDAQNEDFSVNDPMFDEDAVEVTNSTEHFVMPAREDVAVIVAKDFYEASASQEEQEEALVMHNNTYYPNTGVDLATENGESFEVLAALSGTVTRAEKDDLFGNVVEVDHGEGVETYYHSLSEVQVQEGDTVKQSDVIGSAGQNEFNQESGVHLHFEVRKDGEPINPLSVIDKELAVLVESGMNKEDESVPEEQSSEEDADNREENEDSASEPADEESSNEEDQQEENEEELFEEQDENSDASSSDDERDEEEEDPDQ